MLEIYHVFIDTDLLSFIIIHESFWKTFKNT